MRIISGPIALFSTLKRAAFVGVLLIAAALLMAACTPATPTPGAQSAATPTAENMPTDVPSAAASVTPGASADDPVGDMVEKYLQARVSSDEATLRDLTCADQEKNISIHVNSFKGQNASLRDVSCTFDGTSKVSCTGEIVLVYDGEEQTREPGAFTVVQEDGRWLWCGETR